MRLTGSETLVPYGAANWPLERIAEIASSRIAGLPMAAIRPGNMLRINNGTLDLLPAAPTEAEMPMVSRVAAHLKRLYGGWNKAADSFVDQYFAFLACQIDHHRAELDAYLAQFDGLFCAEDFIYSAPLPLPHAFLFAPKEAATRTHAAPDDFVHVDFALWLGDRMVAVLLAPSSLTPMAARQRKERLAASGVEPAECTLAVLDNGQSGWFARVLGPVGSRFWEGEALPSAPGLPSLPDF